MFDPARLRERIEVTKRNLRNAAKTQCASAEDLLRRDDLLDMCIGPALEAYDSELGGQYDLYKQAVANAGKMCPPQ